MKNARLFSALIFTLLAPDWMRRRKQFGRRRWQRWRFSLQHVTTQHQHSSPTQWRTEPAVRLPIHRCQWSSAVQLECVRCVACGAEF
jgi:hypothetical protein